MTNFDAPSRFAFGLTEAEVVRLQDILKKECGIELTLEEAWGRAIELLAVGKLLLASLPPKPSSTTPVA